MKKISLGAIPLAAALALGSLVLPVSAQERDCAFNIGGFGIGCRNDAYGPGYYPGYGYPYTPGYGTPGYGTPRYGTPNYGYNYNRRLSNAEVRPIINSFYRQYLGRNADSEGLRSYLNAYRDGQSLQQIRSSIANSQEARNYSRNYGYKYYR